MNWVARGAAIVDSVEERLRGVSSLRLDLDQLLSVTDLSGFEMRLVGFGRTVAKQSRAMRQYRDGGR